MHLKHVVVVVWWWQRTLELCINWGDSEHCIRGYIGIMVVLSLS